MRRLGVRLAGWAVAASVLVAAVTASAQSLGDVARKEQERRKQIKTPAKVYTNDDLGTAGGGLTTGSARVEVPKPPAGQAAQQASGKPAAPADPAADPTKTEAYWRERITTARGQLSRSQLFLEALQSRVNGLWADFTARDDPAQRAVIERDRQKALAEMDRVRAEIQQQTQAIADIEEEARRAGVPPGWLR